MASIKAKSNGSYLITVSMGRDGLGKQLFERTTFYPTKKSPSAIEKEVRKFALDFEEKCKEGNRLSGDKITFKQYVAIWDRDWASNPENITQRTREEYLRNIERGAYARIGDKKLSKIKADDIQAIITELREEEKAPTTIKKIFSSINSVMGYAYKMGLVHENVCKRCTLPKLTKKKKEVHHFELEQAKRFLEDALNRTYTHTYSGHTRTIKATGTAYQVGEYSESFKIHTQWKAYFNVAIYGGFRRGEMLALTWEDIDFQENTVSINKSLGLSKKNGQALKETKTLAGNREVELPEKVFAILRQWHKEERELSVLLGTKWEGYSGADFDKNPLFIQLDNGLVMSLSTPTHKFKEILSDYNKMVSEEEQLPDIRLHDLRHTSATLLLSENVDIETVASRLGHANPSVTLNVYGHALKKKDKTASDTLARLFA